MCILLQLVNESDDVLDLHEPVIYFLGSVITEDVLSCLLHCRECRSCELVGIDDDVNAVSSKLFFRDNVEALRNDTDRCLLVVCPEFIAELKDLIRFFSS